jgi:hypothetical protein
MWAYFIVVGAVLASYLAVYWLRFRDLPETVVVSDLIYKAAFGFGFAVILFELGMGKYEGVLGVKEEIVLGVGGATMFYRYLKEIWEIMVRSLNKSELQQGVISSYIYSPKPPTTKGGSPAP